MPQASDEHHVTERLAKVVVRTELKTFGLVILTPFGGEHEDRGPIALGTYTTTDLIAVEARQHDVQDYGPIHTDARLPESIRSVMHNINIKSLGLESAGDRFRKPLFVVNHENAHEYKCAPRKRPEAENPLSFLSDFSAHSGQYHRTESPNARNHTRRTQ